MTLPLRRKRPITAPNTRRATSNSPFSSTRPAEKLLIWPKDRIVAGCGALALCLAASLAFPSQARADDAPQSTSSAKLKWHARGAAPQKKLGIEKKLETPEAGELKELPAEVKAPAAPIPTRQTARSRPASQLSTKSSRAKLRDSIMQVSNQVEEPPIDPLKDPFDQSSPGRNRAGEKSDTTPELEMPQTSPSDEQAAPLPNTNDPFPEDRIPVPPGNEPPSYPSGPMDMPAEFGGCENDKKDCSRAINDLRRNTIDTIVVGIVIEGEGGLPPIEGRDYPCECRSGTDASYKPRAWSQTVFNWKATGICHKPLYFEDVHLERYGHSWNPVAQPFLSAAHFFISVPLLPYKMGLNPPQECIYTLGYYRPGNCAPYLIDPIPFSLRAALFEGAAAAGFGYLFFPPAG